VLLAQHQTNLIVDTVEKPCTVETDDHRFSSYTAYTFEWQTDVYPTVIQYNTAFNV